MLIANDWVVDSVNVHCYLTVVLRRTGGGSFLALTDPFDSLPSSTLSELTTLLEL